MGFPIVSEIFDGIRWVIDTVLNKIPNSLKFLLFIFFLLVIGVMIPLLLGIFGVHCNSDKEVVKTSPLKISENLRIAFLDSDDLYNSSSYEPSPERSIGSLTLSSCVFDVCNVSGNIYWAESEDCENQTTTYLLKSSGDAYACVYCNKTKVKIRGSALFGWDGRTLRYACYDSAVKIPFDEMNFYQRQFCDDETDCMPPVHYYFDSTTGLYTCNNDEICGINSSNATVNYEIDERLKEINAEKLYTDDDNKNINKAISIKCDNKLNANLTFFSINLFNYIFWLIIMVIYILVMFLFHVKR